MTIHVMHREVCLKHRKNRREILLRVRTQVPSWQRCLFFFVVCGAGVTTRAAHSRSSSKSKIPERHSGDAGASPADRSNFQNPQHGGRQLAQQSLQNSAGSGQHRDAVPIFRNAGEPDGKAAAS